MAVFKRFHFDLSELYNLASSLIPKDVTDALRDTVLVRLKKQLTEHALFCMDLKYLVASNDLESIHATLCNVMTSKEADKCMDILTNELGEYCKLKMNDASLYRRYHSIVYTITDFGGVVVEVAEPKAHWVMRNLQSETAKVRLELNNLTERVNCQDVTLDDMEAIIYAVSKLTNMIEKYE